ncbi:MAG: Hsp70 family protein [Chitinivibrionales bacterium]|nr:Hsp70 family protein [Chitinivibrionales bacterium]
MRVPGALIHRPGTCTNTRSVNGILNVGAKYLGTGKQQQIRIESSSGLTEEEIQRMIKDAEVHAEEDKAQREKVDVKNRADQLVAQTEQTLQQAGDKVSSEDRSRIKSALDNLKEKTKEEDTEAIKSAMETLTGASHAMAQAMYAQAGAQQQATGGETGGAQNQQAGGNEKTVDADYEEVTKNENKSQQTKTLQKGKHMAKLKALAAAGLGGAALIVVAVAAAKKLKREETGYEKFGNDIDSIIRRAMSRIEQTARQVRSRAGDGYGERANHEINQAVDRARADLGQITSDIKQRIAVMKES